MNPASDIFAADPRWEENIKESWKAELVHYQKIIDKCAQNTIAPMAAFVAISRQNNPKSKWVALPFRDENDKIDLMIGNREVANQVLERIREEGFTAKLHKKPAPYHNYDYPVMTYKIKILDTGRV